MTVFAHHYAFDAVPLLDDCIDKLQKTIDQDLRGRHYALHDMKEVLVSTERLLHVYFMHVLQIEKKKLSTTLLSLQPPPTCITDTMAALKKVLEQKRRHEELNNRKARFWNPQDPVLTPQHSYYAARSAADTLLFRLIVALQLCSVRSDDAHFIIAGRRMGVALVGQKVGRQLLVAAGCCLVGAGVAAVSLSRRKESKNKSLPNDTQLLTRSLAKAGGALIVGKWADSQLRRIWMTNKIVRSTNEIEEWIEQWHMVQTDVPPIGKPNYQENGTPAQQSSEVMDDSSRRRLIEYAMKHSPKSYFWQSQGEIRFLMLKRLMDVYYASVGTAIDVNQTSSWQLPLVAGAAASFYSITGTGASQKASQTVNTASRDLIQHAWGMVSLPAIKSVMLQASRLVKGAAVADRIEICGVRCFVLSREPAPELAAALKRQYKRKAVLSQMSTIAESEEHLHDEAHDRSTNKVVAKQFAGSCGRYRQRDIIMHLTGGGFFAHTIASDLPFLLDWSASTGAVVICPEYALLPEHTYPVALEQVADVYSALVDGDAVMELGFEVNRIVVTGESTGGNLAAALCVQLGTQSLGAQEVLDQSLESENDDMSTDTLGDEPTRLPDAMMLSCAALNLSLELSHSRVIGTQDPVLPSGLISAISDAYVPPGCSKQDPLASPVFAPDSVLRLFPPTLLFAGSNDPLLDDSVTFNERLRCLGVESELRAVHNLPHAYWGLGMAGFPEALEVQHQCEEWLARQLR